MQKSDLTSLSENESVKTHQAKGFLVVAQVLNNRKVLDIEKISSHLEKNILEQEGDESLQQLAEKTVRLLGPTKDELFVSYKLQRFLNVYARMDDKAREEVLGENHKGFTQLIDDSFNNKEFLAKVEFAQGFTPKDIPEPNKTLLDKYSGIMKSLAKGGLEAVKNPPKPPSKYAVPFYQAIKHTTFHSRRGRKGRSPRYAEKVKRSRVQAMTHKNKLIKSSQQPTEPSSRRSLLNWGSSGKKS
tara:strand:+ start:950 stop:1678 length:729 start_codon:yes stop_codon:yes gene_type:complete